VQESVQGGTARGCVEARDGIEPPNKGFAGLSLNIWVPRRQSTYATNIYRLELARLTFLPVEGGWP
jgi:hypothetical protein